MRKVGRRTEFAARVGAAAKKRWEPKVFSADARQLTLAILSEGIPFEAAYRFCEKINVEPLGRYEFNKIIREIGPIFEDLAQKSCEKALSETKSNGIAHDGSWNAKRNAQYLFFSR